MDITVHSSQHFISFSWEIFFRGQAIYTSLIYLKPHIISLMVCTSIDVTLATYEKAHVCLQWSCNFSHKKLSALVTFSV